LITSRRRRVLGALPRHVVEHALEGLAGDLADHLLVRQLVHDRRVVVVRVGADLDLVIDPRVDLAIRLDDVLRAHGVDVGRRADGEGPVLDRERNPHLVFSLVPPSSIS
jgi:hypothetical protein